MPDIILQEPLNSRFHSSMNEIDLAMREIFLKEMRLADPRDKMNTPNFICTNENDNWLWERERVFQVDEMTTEDIFDTWLLRNSKNNKNIDVTYPLLAYKQNDIKNVFWGTGNRYDQWSFIVPVEGNNVAIKDKNYPNLFGVHATIAEAKDNGYILNYKDTDTKIKNVDGNIIIFPETSLFVLDKDPLIYKAKAITGTYSAVILVDNRDEAQYIRDKFILRCNDANIWFTYKSPTIQGEENHIYTVFEVPVLDRYPSNTDKLKGKGYIYGIGIDVNIWGVLTDVPLPANIIRTIRGNIYTYSKENRPNTFVING